MEINFIIIAPIVFFTSVFWLAKIHFQNKKLRELGFNINPKQTTLYLLVAFLLVHFIPSYYFNYLFQDSFVMMQLSPNAPLIFFIHLFITLLPILLLSFYTLFRKQKYKGMPNVSVSIKNKLSLIIISIFVFIIWMFFVIKDL